MIFITSDVDIMIFCLIPVTITRPPDLWAVLPRDILNDWVSLEYLKASTAPPTIKPNVLHCPIGHF